LRFIIKILHFFYTVSQIETKRSMV